MKKLMILCGFIFLVLSPCQFAHAEASYSGIFTIVGDAMMKTKAGEWDSAEALAEQLTADWKKAKPTGTKEAENVDQAIESMNAAVKQHNQEKMLSALSDVSHALVALEKEQNPVDEKKQREEIKAVFTPILSKLDQAIASKNVEQANIEYKMLVSAWGKKESVIREQSIAYYGQIETQMGLLRIALTQEEKDFSQMAAINGTMTDAFNGFVSGKERKASNEKHSLQTLVDLLVKTEGAIDNGQPKEAVSRLQEFLTVWPSIEGEVRTRDGGLYSKIESEIPVIAGKLSSSNVNLEEQKHKVSELKNKIEFLQKKTSYTMWDAALILLREGLEALLIVAALIAFLRKANARQYQKWIWIGALFGIVMSVCAAIFINVMFTAASKGANREAIEGMTGIIAVVMMIGVGMWLHKKSNMKLWNQYIEKQMGTALSTGSIASMAFVSFLSIFREGAETIIFYMGMAPSIETEKLAGGIGVAAVILAAFAFLLVRYSAKIAIGPFFKMATILIYFLAFKILGVSIHALQLTNHIHSTQLNMPTINWLGLYPSMEVLVPQVLLLAIILITSLTIRRSGKQAEAM